VSFRAAAGTTYYFMVDSCCGGGGNLTLHVNEIPPPADDDFANATPIAAVPFTDQVDATGSTAEAGEPLPTGCNVGSPAWSVWYAYTPASSGSVTASSSLSNLAAYTGSSVSGLTQVGCSSFGPMTIAVTAGVTYHFQVANFFGLGAPLTFRLDPAPAPVASFVFQPTDPAAGEGIRFISTSTDPGNASFRSWDWTFGDGGTAAGDGPVHQYAADGDYTVGLTVRTDDGRTASTTRAVHVATHDVAIAAFSVPATARAGQTKTIEVDILNTRYPETVQVDLKRLPAVSLETVASQTLPVPVGTRRQPTTRFVFTYTFTDGDAALGKVTFEAVATIIGARDSLTTDNTVIAPITRVSARSSGNI
jgi:PKD repeat protein